MGNDREISDSACVTVTYVVCHSGSVVSMYTDMYTIANAGPVSSGRMAGLYRRECCESRRVIRHANMPDGLLISGQGAKK